MTQHLTHFIAGASAEASDGARMQLVNPVDEQPYATAARGTAADVPPTCSAPARAEQLEGGAWSRLAGIQRGRLLSRLADLVERDTDLLLADMDAHAIGRSPMEPRMMDVPNAVANLRARPAGPTNSKAAPFPRRATWGSARSPTPCASRSAWSAPFCRGTRP